MGIVTIAFDDGYLSTFDSCAEYLKKKGICATFAVPSSLIGVILENRPVIDEENIKTLIKDGHEIAAHTTKHLNLLDLYGTSGLEAVRDEMRLSKERLESLFGVSVETMVFPFIEANQNGSLRELSSNYYSSCRITTENLVSNELPVKDPFSVTGVALTRDLPVEEYNNMVEEIEKEDRWLIEVFHLVSEENTKSAHRDEPYRFFTHIDDFKKHIEFMLSKNIPVMPQREVVRKFK